jgi:16S rRNA (uracil1498-N3)-methyltransferase
MAHRYFTTDDIDGETARITGSDAAHLAKVLRVQKGAKLVLCNGAGIDYEAEVVAVTPEEVALNILKFYPTAAEPALRAEVYIGYGKGDKMEWAVQKAVELGAARVVPFFSKYTVVKAKNEEQKNLRYARIAHEAAKQSGRGVLPQVAMSLEFEQMLAEAAKAEVPLFFYEEGGETLRTALLATPKTVAIITGPEGGFAPEEAEQAKQAGCKLVGLGPRILRCETAPVAALAAVMALSGNLE